MADDLPLPPDLLARMLDYDDQDEHSNEVHYDLMEEAFSALGTPEHRVGLAEAFWAAEDERVKALGFDLLAVPANEFDWHVQPVVDASAKVAVTGSARSTLRLRRAAAGALASIDDPTVLAALLRFAEDEDSEVRWNVARGIPVDIDPLPEHAVAILTGMLRDEDSDVRDWSAFTLGMKQNDSPEIRDALARLLYDADEDTAAEAAGALALRKDQRARPAIEEALARPDAGRIWFESAAELADPALLPLLRAVKARGVTDSELDRAIENCAAAQGAASADAG